VLKHPHTSKLSTIIFIILLSQSGSLNPEIKKQLLKDGTVSYYNNSEELKTAKRIDFKSQYNNMIESISSTEGVDPYLVKCIVKVESDFKADAVSVAGAMGLMQIMQEIARYYNIKDPLDPKENLTAGIKHLKSLLNYFQSDVSLAVAGYHAGLGRVKKDMKIPPIQATVDYVNNVMHLYNGKKENNLEKIKKLYKRINSEGVIEIYNK
jgi:soluble lytic murein transglycosylase-like protein